MRSPSDAAKRSQELKAWAAFVKAQAAYDKAGDASDKAWVAFVKARAAFDKARVAEGRYPGPRGYERMVMVDAAPAEGTDALPVDLSDYMAGYRQAQADLTGLDAAPAEEPTDNCGAPYPERPGTTCRRDPGHSGEHATARRDVQWDNSYLSTSAEGPTDD